MLTYERDTATDAANRDIENTAGTAAWNAQDDAVVIFLREDTKTYTGSHFGCFTGTKVQILTRKTCMQSTPSLLTYADVC